jgi:hypothetical protein
VDDTIGSEHCSVIHGLARAGRLTDRWPVVGLVTIKFQEKNWPMASDVITVVVLFLSIQTVRSDHIKGSVSTECFKKIPDIDSCIEAFNPLKGSIPARIDADRSEFEAYHQWSMDSFEKDKLVPGCVAGEAAPEAFRQALYEAVTTFIVDKNVDNFANTLAGRETVGCNEISFGNLPMRGIF